MKKYILFIVLFALLPLATLAGNQTSQKSQKTGTLPNSPLYFFEKAGESIKNVFTFGAENKINRFLELTNERLNEAKEMLNQTKLEIAGKVINSSEKLLQKATDITKKIKDENTKKEFLNKIKIKLTEKNEVKKTLLENLKKESITKTEMTLNKNELGVTDTTTPEYEELPQYTIEVDKKIKVIEESNTKDPALIKNNPLQNAGPAKTYNANELGVTDTTTDNTPGLIEDWRKPGEDPQIMLAPTNSGGKPGMENGGGQIVRPEGHDGSCTKLNLCKIECGSNIIENCNSYSSPKLYDLLSCRGNCVGYQLFYGCSMEQGCDEPCWDDYNNACSPEKYQSCLTGCEEQFKEC